MKKGKVTLLALITVAVISTGCIASQASTSDLVSEGTRLTYENPGYGNTTFAFFNETKNKIQVREASGGIPEFYTIYKENLTTQGEHNFEIGLPNQFKWNKTEINKINNAIENGETTSIYRDGQKVLEVRNTGKAIWNGIKAYKIVLESEPIDFNNTITAEEPYLLLNSSTNRGGGLTLEKVERDVSINMSEYRNAEALKQEENISGNVKASATELDFSTVYSTENDEGEKMISFVIRNSGERDINPENFRVTYRPDRNSQYREYADLDEMWKTGGNDCLEQGGVVRPSGSFQCHTGLSFPEPPRGVEIKIESTEFDYEISYTCSPVTEGSRTC